MMTQAGGIHRAQRNRLVASACHCSAAAVLSLVAIGRRMRGHSGSRDHLDGRCRSCLNSKASKWGVIEDRD